MSEFDKREREAAEKIAATLALPSPGTRDDIGAEGFFDPWQPFQLYGSYCASFDACAIEVLLEIQSGNKVRDDLGAEMFREMLCNMYLCDYGSSPRFCFPATRSFAEILPAYIAKWEAFSKTQWSDAEQ